MGRLQKELPRGFPQFGWVLDLLRRPRHPFSCALSVCASGRFAGHCGAPGSRAAFPPPGLERDPPPRRLGRSTRARPFLLASLAQRRRGRLERAALPAHMRAVVIGAGLGGLAAALRLRARGWQVTVCEAGPTFGGKMNHWEQAGYSFDTGPSLITMP